MSEPTGELEPKITLQVGSQEFELRRSNAEIFHYMGSLAVWNHLFILDNEDDEIQRGTFVPQLRIGEEAFTEIMVAMLKNEYPARLNQRHVAPGDVEILTKMARGGEIPDEVPEEWFNEDNS